MKILVTGSEGFIGRYLVRELRKQKNDIIEFRHFDGDLRERSALSEYKNADVVFHMAAKTFVPESWDMPYEYINDNNTMLLNVLDYCRENDSKLVFPSTYLYGEPQYLPVDENHICVSNTPYHLCKRIGEEICEFYSRNFGINVLIVRPFNVYGFGQSSNFLLPKVYEQVKGTNETIEVFTLNPRRDYIYVEDLVIAMIRLIPYIKGFDIYNIGSGKSYSVGEAIRIIQEEMGTSKEVIAIGQERKNEVMDCVADVSKITNILGDINFTTLEEGIHKWHTMEDL